ncbi:ThuA domain-containing protein [Deinococcus roseus]|uniref:ThuA-like domain-containing protein n=1 Tax=Deinococcus roseus TaxID=392414 RepID=A0ABQ2D0A0_9DEIO|nr:ThuA domain-containing protein [Deinococcus roseus]GGJ38572.1 hypothetical protein GCM10008938_25870 [Deinococcus roseus]
MPKALIVYGGWEGHAPAQFNTWFRQRLERNGFEVQSLDRIEDITPESVQVDLIVPHWTMGKLTPQASQLIREAVLNGTGLAGIHGGMGDAFREDTEFQFMTGGQFVCHPGNIRPYSVQIKDHDHPISQGLQDFQVQTEQYYMHVDPANHVLATTTFDDQHAPWIAGTVMPIAWTRQHGKGRVFYHSLGHALSDMQVPEVEALTLRGFLWAARKE